MKKLIYSTLHAIKSEWEDTDVSWVWIREHFFNQSLVVKVTGHVNPKN